MASMLSTLLTQGRWPPAKQPPVIPAPTPVQQQIPSRRSRSNGKGPDSSVRFGRVPKREKAKILAAMQKVNASSQEKALIAELEDEAKLLFTIINAHDETCDFTADKVAPLLERARSQPIYTKCPPQLACPLNPNPHPLENGGSSRILEDFSERFSPAIRGVVEFAKRIPGFGLLAQDDQVTLLKAGVFEVLLVRLACMFDAQTNSMICLNGQVLRREALHSASNARFLLDSMFDFAERLNVLRLLDTELGLFCAVVVIAADRPGLRNTELVQRIQKKLTQVLQKAVTANHPENPGIFAEIMKKIPDLRTLNTLHSEKLLAYKMEPRNQGAAAQGTLTTAPATVAGVPLVTVPSSTSTPVLSYSAISAGHWAQLSPMLLAAPQCSTSVEEDNRSTSPGQQSQHGGSVCEWSTSDAHEPFGSPRSVASSGMSTDEAKSPVRTASFSSTKSYDTESLCSDGGGSSHIADFHPQLTKRLREGVMDHGCSSGDEGYIVDSPVKSNGGSIGNGVISNAVASNGVYTKMRRVDSPTDSGIESGKEHGTGSTPATSICSSPRSIEEKVKDVSDSEGNEKQESIDDMPVLKRALQAPPLINTNMLMDEAYRHHKKFRAARKEQEDPASPTGSSTSPVGCPITQHQPLASTHSTLVKTLKQAPLYMNEQQLKRTDLIHNIIMRTESIPPSMAPPSSTTTGAPTATTNSASSLGNSFVYSVPHAGQQVGPNGVTATAFVPSVTTQNGKSVVVCPPPGYYIPAGVAVSNYPPTTSPTSWQFVAPSPSSMTTTATFAVANGTITMRQQPFISSNGQPVAAMTVPHHHHQQQQQQAPPQQTVVALSAIPHPATSGSPHSPNQRLVYDPRSPGVGMGSSLVISNTVPPTSPPLHGNSHLDARVSPPCQQPPVNFQADTSDTPLNLSKKSSAIISRQTISLKMES